MFRPILDLTDVVQLSLVSVVDYTRSQSWVVVGIEDYGLKESNA
jgi:hypothetical protein